MSSMRNAVQRRNHKERSQPKERERWGILEKHKDYSLRATDYNLKKSRLKTLRQKAAERNPDEFYYGMYSSSTHDKGQKIASRGNESLSQEAVKLLKTQDAGYLRTVAQVTRRAREKLEGGFVVQEGEGVRVRGGAGEGGGEKVVFVGSREEQRGFGMDDGAGKASQTDSRLLENGEALNDAVADEDEEQERATQVAKPMQKSKRALQAEAAALKQARLLRKQRKREQEAQLSRLRALKTREKDILAAEQELALQRAKMSNSVGGVNKAGVKFKVRERNR